MDYKFTKVGKYNSRFNDILGVDIDELDIYQSEGLYIHMLKRKHYKALKYIDRISEIIETPDYIGINPNEASTDSIELIKKYDDNILIGIKLDKSGEYLYVSTMHDVQDRKVRNRLHSGRIKEFNIDNSDKQ